MVPLRQIPIQQIETEPPQSLSTLMNSDWRPLSVDAHDEFFWIDAVDNVLIVAVTDAQGTILYANKKFCTISGYTQSELMGENHRILNSGFHEPQFFANMYRTIKSAQIWRGEICNRSKNGELYWVATTIIPRLDDAGNITHYVACRFDITEQKAAQRELANAASTDSLTGLLNRAAFQRRFDDLVAKDHPSVRSAAIAMIDIDSFKDINDIYGHQVGDCLLKVVAQRLSMAVSSDDMLGRFGGDEICVFIGNILSEDDLRCRLERLQSAIREQIELNLIKLGISASIGLALCPEHGTVAEELFKKVDMALYSAKKLGRNRYEFYTEALQEAITKRFRIQDDARKGLLAGEFSVFYQPIWNCQTKLIESMEALLRWQHPEYGLIAPGQFWDVFEDQCLTAELGQFIRGRILDDAAAWIEAGVPFGRLGYNATSADFSEPDFAMKLMGELSSRGLSSDMIAIEVTEGMFLGRKAARVKEQLFELHRLGFEIAFDDFGTGYASLTHLKELPLDRLKIDRSFIKDLEHNDVDRQIVRGIISLAHSLGLVVTVEGVENEAQLAAVVEMGADKIQGYFVSRPAKKENISVVISEINSKAY